jgi:hypothetical protein
VSEIAEKLYSAWPFVTISVPGSFAVSSSGRHQ